MENQVVYKLRHKPTGLYYDPRGKFNTPLDDWEIVKFKLKEIGGG